MTLSFRAGGTPKGWSAARNPPPTPQECGGSLAVLRRSAAPAARDDRIGMPLAVGYGRAVPNPGRMGARVSHPPTGIRHGAAVPCRNRDEVYNKKSDEKGIPEIIIPGSATVPSATSGWSSRTTSRRSSTTSRDRTSLRSNRESPAHRRARLRRAELPWVVAVR
jgi:hypothetical protein